MASRAVDDCSGMSGEQAMPEVKILARDEAIPSCDLVLVRTRLASNNSVVTDIIGVKDGMAVKTITDRQLSPDVAIEKACEIADTHDIDLIYVKDEL
jgi:hypothetical protein